MFVCVLARINPLSYQVQWVCGIFNGGRRLWDFLAVLALLVVAGTFSLMVVRGLRIARGIREPKTSHLISVEIAAYPPLSRGFAGFRGGRVPPSA